MPINAIYKSLTRSTQSYSVDVIIICTNLAALCDGVMYGKNVGVLYGHKCNAHLSSVWVGLLYINTLVVNDILKNCSYVTPIASMIAIGNYIQ